MKGESGPCSLFCMQIMYAQPRFQQGGIMCNSWDTIASHRRQFELFAENWLARYPSPMLQLKYEHTHAVLAHAACIVGQEKVEDPLGRAGLLAALYHDVGRFPQYATWKTFSDAHSKNHGFLGVQLIKRSNFLKEESDVVRQLVLAAVGLHNRYRLPPGIPSSVCLVTRIVRDADKLDIMRIMANHLNRPVPSEDVVLHVKDDPEGWSPKVVETVLSGKVPGYSDLRYINDFRILLGSWLQDLHFETARVILVRSGHFEQVLDGLPKKPPFTEVCSYLYGVRDALVHERHTKNDTNL